MCDYVSFEFTYIVYQSTQSQTPAILTILDRVKQLVQWHGYSLSSYKRKKKGISLPKFLWRSLSYSSFYFVVFLSKIIVLTLPYYLFNLVVFPNEIELGYIQLL